MLVGSDVKQQELSFIAGENVTNTANLKTVWQFLTKLTIVLTIQSSNCTPRHFPERVENLCPHKTCMQMSTAALPIIAKTWRWTRCPSVGEQKKMWYFHTLEYYSRLKRNRLLCSEKTWKNFKCILQREGSTSEIWYLGESKLVETVETSEVARGSGVGAGTDKQVEHRGFGGSDTILYATSVADTRQHALLRAHRSAGHEGWVHAFTNYEVITQAHSLHQGSLWCTFYGFWKMFNGMYSPL